MHSEIVEFKVMGKDVELVWNEEKGHYNYDTTVTFEEDGSHVISLYAKDVAGNEASLSNTRFVIVDTTAPGLEVVSAPAVVSNDTTTVNLVAHLTDNFDEISYYVDGSEVFAQDQTGYGMVAFDKEVTTEVSVEPGNNVFELKIVDIAGNTTIKEVEVFRESVSRVSGSDRYDTSVEVSQKGWDSAETVVLARGDDYADALAGVPLAHKLNAPILINRKQKIYDATLDELKRLGATNVILLGGESAISKAVETQLEEDFEVKRISGENRFDTAAKIASKVSPEGTAEVVVVNGMNFPDALSVASHAAQEGLPILLTEAKKLSKETEKALEDLNAYKTVVIGGTTVVSQVVELESTRA